MGTHTFRIKLPDEKSIEKCDRMAKEHPDEAVRDLAEMSAGLARCIISIAEALPEIAQSAVSELRARP